MSETPSMRPRVGWAGSALLLTASVAVVAKIAGVILAPAARGLFASSTVNLVDTASGAFAYTLTALLVALVAGASFELARTTTLSMLSRGSFIVATGLVVALASPAVIERLSAPPSVLLAIVSSAVALATGVVVMREPETRAVGTVLVLLAFCGMCRMTAWATAAMFVERGSPSIALARGFATGAVGLQAIAALLAAAWIGTRSKWRGRLLANIAIVVAFAATWIAERGSDSPSAIEAVLRVTLPTAAGLPSPYHLGSIASFLLPASILLGAVALLQPGRRAVIVALSLALLSNGSFDVPLQALLVTTSAQWALLAMLADRKEGVAAKA